MVPADDQKIESAELGRRISGAIGRMMEASIVDEKVLDLCLKETALALFQTDVQFKLVRDLQTNVKDRVQNASSAADYDKQNIIHAIFDEVCKILDPGKPSFSLVETQTRIVLFVGLQGSGKTRACAQFANYYKKKGFRPAIVSADTFRASNFDQLMQNTMAATIPLFGSFMQSDPVAKNAIRGINWFQKRSNDIKRSYDLIIIDTSERHTQVSSLIGEMCNVSEATKPDLVIFVVDSAIGLAAFHQVQSFNQTVKVGAVIIMSRANYDQKVGEAVSAMAATKTSVMFIGRGERLEEFEVFDIKPFVSRLLGLGEFLGFKEDVPVDEQPKFLTNYTLRVYKMFVHISDEKGPFRGLNFIQGRTWNEESKKKDRLLKLRILNSMKNEELDGRLQNLLSCSFILRIAKRSSSDVIQVLLLMEDHKCRVEFFEVLDRGTHPVCKYLDKIIPGVIMAGEVENKPAKRKKTMSGEAEEDEESNNLTREELMEISKNAYPSSKDSERVKQLKLRRLIARHKWKPSIEEEEKMKKKMEDRIVELRALYGKPLEANKDDGEDSKMRAVVEEEAQEVAELRMLCL